MSLPHLPSLVGPTCSGKTAVAVVVAKRVRVEILSADSRQVYRRFDAGTAKPTAEERAAVPHHLVDVADPEESYTAARFGSEARRVAAEVRARGALPFLVGGSGLYLRAAEEGLFEGPAANRELRVRLTAEADRHGDAALHARLRDVDPETAERVGVADRVRVIRALEVFELTGMALSEHHRRHRVTEPEFRFQRFAIDWPVEILRQRIEERVDVMLAGGWREEVARLLEDGLPRDAPAWNAHGYPEVRAWHDGEMSAAEARQRIINITRRYAKRQRTWFRALPDVTWFRIERDADLPGVGERIARALRDV